MGWTISWDEFKLYASDFLSVSDGLGDGWAWRGDKNYPGGAFIVKKEKREMNETLLKGSEMEIPEDSSLQTELQDTGMIDMEVSQCIQITWDYHVLYSQSYSTPVLYFNAFTPDGRLLPLEVLWKGLKSSAYDVLQQMRWEALSQQEHPVLRRPYFQLHPCKTAEFLGIHQCTSNNPLVTWLSSIGPAIGLNFNHKYSHLVLKSKISDSSTD